jgi:hypothetical protein
LAGVKAVLLIWALGHIAATRDLVLSLNAVFATIYLASALLTYSALRLPSKAI